MLNDVLSLSPILCVWPYETVRLFYSALLFANFFFIVILFGPNHCVRFPVLYSLNCFLEQKKKSIQNSLD